MFKRQAVNFGRKLVTSKCMIANLHLNIDNVTKEMFEENSEEFKKEALRLARIVSGNRTVPYSYAYAGVCAFFAELFELPYDVYAGYCMSKASPIYDKEVEIWENTKNKESHPRLSNHIYIVVGDKSYESFTGLTSEVTHFDVIPVEVEVQYESK